MFLCAIYLKQNYQYNSNEKADIIQRGKTLADDNPNVHFYTVRKVCMVASFKHHMAERMEHYWTQDQKVWVRLPLLVKCQVHISYHAVFAWWNW